MQSFMKGGYRAMRELREQGVVRAIGLGVNEWQVCEEVLATRRPRHHSARRPLHLNRAGGAGDIPPLCVRRGIAVVAGGPYNSGILARDQPMQPAANYDYGRAPRGNSREGRITKCSVRATSRPARCGRAAISRAPAVVSVIPGMSSAAEVLGAVGCRFRFPRRAGQELREQCCRPAPISSLHDPCFM